MKLFDDDKLAAIVKECSEHNADIGADVRPADRVLQDAKNIYIHRHVGISVETLCMMLTDLQFAIRDLRGGDPKPTEKKA